MSGQNPIQLNNANLITPEQTAQYLGVSIGTLSVWRSSGRWNLPFVKVGSRVMYNPADIQAFIERRTHTQTV